MSIYTLAFREDEDSAQDDGQQRLDAAAQLMTTIGDADREALVVLPAGFAIATSPVQRDEWAAAMAAASRSAGVALIFGIDVPQEQWGLERCPRSFAYASDRGRRLLWAISAANRRATPARTVTFGAVRATIVFARELLEGQAARMIEAAQPELTIVLGHGPPTLRWEARLREVEAIAPTLVVHQEIPMRQTLALAPPRGWSAQPADGDIKIVTYRREAVGAAAGAVGN